MLWLAFLFLCGLARATLQIVSGATWTPTNQAAPLEAHGGSILYVDGTYYFIGQDVSNSNAFLSVNCYSSTNLVQWEYVGALLSQQGSGDLGPNRVVERPKVIYNSNTKQYVMWMHIDSSDYSEAKVGVATGSSVCGSYHYLGSWQPLGYQSRDMGLFQDDNGTGYLLSEDRANGLRIDQLTSNYLNVSSATYLFEDLEAPAMIKKNGIYYIFASHLTGYSPNDNVYATATNIAGPWSSFNTFATVGSNTYDSQTTFILPVGNNVMYMGDRYISSQLMSSTYVWLPLELQGTTASMSNYVNWLPSTFAGGPSETDNNGSSATLSNGAKLVSCSGCSSGEAAGYLGGPSDGSALFAQVSSTATTQTTIRIAYENGDAAPRYADVLVNQGAAQSLAFLPTGSGNTPLDAVVTVGLSKGNNQIVIRGYNASYAPDVSRLMVPDY